ncbi:hypothetical protein [Paenibacillus sp. 1781tsa1]|uniref:hypothetical protein n=1 Tax=Paenibacillus sp. 1781tsa1 TaxID=2953810 RepID=UPI0020A16F86|nr:hypothetical protein [Paenibacillus sp. 1781tsa1]MCP1183996.1 hypothetical protein [Paenibacillus sp. 1781tsa1]
MVNAIHNFYDAMQKEGINIDWYSIPELCIMLAIRNARHHNQSNRIRSIYNYHLQNLVEPTIKADYLLVDFPGKLVDGKRGGFFKFHISWDDIENFISLPRDQSRLRSGSREMIRNYLNADNFEMKSEDIPKERIFINVVPLIINAGIYLSPFIDNLIFPKSTESKVFYRIFKEGNGALTVEHELIPAYFSFPPYE